MKLEAKERLALTAKKATFGPKVLMQMSVPQLKQLSEGMRQIDNWFGGSYVKQGGTGKLIMSGEAELTLVINTMFWLSKYFAPKTLDLFPRVWRLHDLIGSGDKAQSGEIVTIKPFKPILSWSDTPDIKVQGRSQKKSDVIIELDNPKVVFSYKTSRFINAKNAQKLQQMVDKLRKKVPPEMWNALDDVSSRFGTLSKQLREFNEEREVIVYTPKPFKAKIYKAVAAESKAKFKAEVDRLVSQLNINPKKVKWVSEREAQVKGGPTFLSSDRFADLQRAIQSPSAAFLRKHLGGPPYVFNTYGRSMMWKIKGTDVRVFWSFGHSKLRFIKFE